jgi:MFS family permease
VYALVLLVTLLVFGPVSDYLGRQPVILAALMVTAAAYKWRSQAAEAALVPLENGRRRGR